ncbi:hypothetical protein M5D96_003316 [Drosophila gunungcola]|uniref:Uncharacterized protein n=1 Tax=Drosophila gunungcola TaxID=103775 RepID=A0A9P9YS19_9MUSC|nr:hypothetical protein M5D96_003316 [Drosophila gunungcola]
MFSSSYLFPMQQKELSEPEFSYFIEYKLLRSPSNLSHKTSKNFLDFNIAFILKHFGLLWYIPNHNL